MEKIDNGNTKSGLSKVISLVSDSMPQGNYRADGVVLRRRETSPKSCDCLLFLRDMGAFWAGAPGPRSRFGGAAEPMIWGRFILYQGPRKLYLKSIDVAEDFLSVRNSKKSLLCAARWCKELGSRLPLGHENNAVLSLFWGSMTNLSKGLSIALLDVRFAWRWGKIWGVAPSLDSCPECGSPLLSDEGIVMTKWGFLCRACNAASPAQANSTRHKAVSPEAFDITKLASLSSVDGFVRAEPEIRARFATYAGLEREVGEIASRLFVFLTFVM